MSAALAGLEPCEDEKGVAESMMLPVPVVVGSTAPKVWQDMEVSKGREAVGGKGK